jgi:hypothetical protein
MDVPAKRDLELGRGHFYKVRLDRPCRDYCKEWDSFYRILTFPIPCQHWSSRTTIIQSIVLVLAKLSAYKWYSVTGRCLGSNETLGVLSIDLLFRLTRPLVHSDLAGDAIERFQRDRYYRKLLNQECQEVGCGLSDNGFSPSVNEASHGLESRRFELIMNHFVLSISGIGKLRRDGTKRSRTIESRRIALSLLSSTNPLQCHLPAVKSDRV